MHKLFGDGIHDDTLAIQERRNEALRRNHCPKRYWADMTELKGEL